MTLLQIRVPFLGCPHNKIPTILGSIFGPRILRNSHLCLILQLQEECGTLLLVIIEAPAVSTFQTMDHANLESSHTRYIPYTKQGPILQRPLETREKRVRAQIRAHNSNL